MTEKSYWNRFTTMLRKTWRVIWKKYQKETKAFVSSHVDSAFMDLGKHVDSKVQKQIRDDVVSKAISKKIDIYTSSGANTVKGMIDEYMEKFGGGE